jgi:hypothetical protein
VTERSDASALSPEYVARAVAEWTWSGVSRVDPIVGLDPGIAPWVELLRAWKIETHESCQGGPDPLRPGRGQKVYTAAGEFVDPPKPRRRMPTRVPQLSDAQARLLYELYGEKNVGVPALARLVWRRLGYGNEVSCANAIYRAFSLRGFKLRSACESTRRTPEGKRLLGFGGERPGERVLDARTVDRLRALYDAGYSTRELSRRFHRRFGYDEIRFRSVVEYAWKMQGLRMRTNREAELLSRSKMRRRCPATTTGRDGRRPRPCKQRPQDGSEYCLHHDPERRAEVEAHAAALRARKTLKPKVAWATVRPHLEPLLVPRPDRFGRQLETASGALARNTGIDPAIVSRLLKGRKDEITVDYANKLLAPLGLTVETIALRAAA